MNNTPNLDEYDKFIVAFSGGKDSWACVLHLLDSGVPTSKVELWHHRVDGLGNSFMDWPCTDSYVDACAKALGVPVYFSWKTGGFEREMLRDNTPTAPICFEDVDGSIKTVGGRGKGGTRLRFPQVSPNLNVRWCSAYLKIDVGDAMLRNRFDLRGLKVLFVTGERGEESASRKRYPTFTKHRADLRDGKKHQRHIDHWRPVHGWTETQVWSKLQQHGINPHPAYRLGWGRVSCMKCIFGGVNQWASIQKIDPDGLGQIASYENQFGVTIHRSQSVKERASQGQPYPMNKVDIKEALSQEWQGDIMIPVGEWKLPAGAFGESCGPT